MKDITLKPNKQNTNPSTGGSFTAVVVYEDGSFFEVTFPGSIVIVNPNQPEPYVFLDTAPAATTALNQKFLTDTGN